MLLAVFVIGLLLFALGYRFYGKYVERALGVQKGQPTPAHTMQDGVDYDPSPSFVLFGHHFSTIAGTGPILGPIIAALAFGWGPALLWIFLGCVFLGAPFDYSCMIASIRNKGKSLGEVARAYMGTATYKIFLCFVLVALVYFIIVLVDTVAATFSPSNPALSVQGNAAATASLAYILLAVALGIARKNLIGFWRQFFYLFIPFLVFVATVFSNMVDINYANYLPEIKGSVQLTWVVLLLIYCVTASVLPVWVLLQPRDYLSAYLLFACLFGGVVGCIVGTFSGSVSVQYPIFTGWNDAALGPIFPVLFVTIACGAISGFHGVVASGTTSKQLDKIEHALPIGYGGMLMEGVLALLSVTTVMILAKGGGVGNTPQEVFAAGLASFLVPIGLSPQIVGCFALLAISTFVLTSLDSCTRMCRMLLQEILGMKNDVFSRTIASLAIVLVPILTIFFNDTGVPVWKLLWPIFGATNQLLAALGLFMVFIWYRKTHPTNKAWGYFLFVPMVIMFVVTISALVLLVVRNMASQGYVVASVSFLLLVMTIAILVSTMIRLKSPKKA